ncbi:MAG: peptidase U62 [Acidobacteria bacterium]|nr:peptidase U62 [Acidobacteriota bacterium]
MKNKWLSKFTALCLLVSLIQTSAYSQEQNVLLQTVTGEMNRAFSVLKEKGDPPPYFLSYRVTDVETTTINTSLGALQSDDTEYSRTLDTSIRVGDYEFDNTRDTQGMGGSSLQLPMDDDPYAIKNMIWVQTDAAYKAAVSELRQAKQNQQTTIAREFSAADFSKETPEVSRLEVKKIEIDKKAWAEKLRKFSSIFNKYPLILSSSVSLSVSSTNKYFVSTEKTSLQYGSTEVRIGIFGTTKADDGMELYRYESFDATAIDGLPDDAKIIATIERVAKDLNDLRNAPTIEPFTGPAILSGRASGVFFHEIFGHRIEGHRQKSEYEGNTFTAKVNQPVLPSFFSVVDDPTMRKFGETELSGFYQFDDEGIRSQRVPLVQNGILKTFLLGRSPIKGFSRSNGHGRAQPGLSPVSRQGNLIVQASRTVSKAQLRKLLIAEVIKQKKSFGLFFDDISGGFTNTSRFAPQAFQVTPIMVYKVFPDGRPDQLVRGLDLIGTPLTAFSKIIAADNSPEIFNGVCGAESGMVPVSAISPGILLTQIEVQKKPKSEALPPILPPPGVDAKIWKEIKR